MAHLFIDIETIETTNEDIIQNIRDNIKHPGNIKKPESIEKWYTEKLDDAVALEVSKTSFSGLSGSICSIAWAVDDEPVNVLYRGLLDSEEVLLTDFFDAMTDYGNNFSPVWTAHNFEFDLRFLFQRCVVNNVKPTINIPYNQKPWNKDISCTLYETMGAVKAGGSLSKIALAFGIKGKLEGMDGSMVNQYFLDGKIEEIAEYNRQDVSITREIFKKLNFTDSVADTQNSLL